MAKVNVKNTTSSLKDIGSVLAGLAAGKISGDKAIAMLHPTYGPLAGSIVSAVLIAVSKNRYAKLFFTGMGAVHIAQFIKAVTEGKTGFLSLVNSYTPSLSGRVGGMGRLRRVSPARSLGQYSTVAEQLGMVDRPAAPVSTAAQLMGAN